MHTGYHQGEMTSWATNQASIPLRKFKLYQANFSYYNIIRLEMNYQGNPVKKEKTQTYRC